MPVPLPVIKVEKSEEKDASARRPPECWGERHTFVLMAFLGYTLCFTLRVDLAVAIVAMVNTTSGTNGGEPPEQCPPVGGRSAADEVSDVHFVQIWLGRQLLPKGFVKCFLRDQQTDHWALGSTASAMLPKGNFQTF